MYFPTSCCTLPPVESNYTPTGSNVQLEDFSVYETGDTKSYKLLICLYDIFGFHPVTKQFCDKLSSSGFRVVMPDFFRGKPFPSETYPPKDRQVLVDFVTTSGSWEKVVKGDLCKLFEHYRGQGVGQIGMFGFCWGALMCVSASCEYSSDIKAIALIHPSLVKDEDGDRVMTPVLVLPASGDADMVPFYEKVKARFGEDGSGHHRFVDVPHGFCAARGNMEDELNRKRVDEALTLTHKFFSKQLK
ncbi:uncharacterized AIM2 family protein C30D10.14 [Folsomia candida]|uniref:Carboxymethylenebutenolidase n=1 Tax=Folsomia candida TaxID=158441 RepID=A0A226EI58_FOLCA|nr:uncharacterized AIM2 family protein C30D10.14 [Folsomia candida]OXA56734.1 Carboxymethylenebutenolidase [Folsomia candida]